MTEISIGESLAWLAVSRPHIGLARVAAEDTAPGPGMLHTRRFDLRLEAVVTGRPPELAEFRTVVADGVEAAVGAQVLIFSDVNRVVDAVIGLDRPDLGPALTASFEALTDPEAILAIVEASLERLGPVGPDAAVRARRLHEPQRGFLRFAVPEGTAARQVLFTGGACYLIMPTDPAFEVDILRHSRSDDPWERARAAHQLANYSDPDVGKRLRELLADPGTVVAETLSSGRRTQRRVNPPAQVAFDVLTELGFEVDRPDGYLDDFPYQFVWPGSAALAP